VLAKYLAIKYPESFDSSVPESLVYSGSKKLTDEVEGSELNVGQLILSPTRTYAPVIIAILKSMRSQIHGMVHCSGGAQTKILHFVHDVHVVKDHLFLIPPLFELIQKESGTDFKEMYQVFNMGHRMELYVSSDRAEEIIQISQSFGIPAQIVGHVEAFSGKKLSIRSSFGEFIYE
jgi:phosphoribosylformylglycinamidine cyclo-ligase